jgi:predicted lipoprotein with Yx(FWY)xxD motif
MVGYSMPPTRRTLLRASAIGVVGSIAGYTDATEGRQGTEMTQQTKATTEQMQATGYTVQVTTHPDYGVILTNGEGMTLYRFTQDEDGESTCYDQCAEAWPPLTVEESMSIPDGLPGEFETTERRDGSMQVTYNEMPLYYFANDEEPGDTNGQGVNDVWFVVNPECPSPPVVEETTESDDTGDGGDNGSEGDSDEDDGDDGNGGPGY